MKPDAPTHALDGIFDEWIWAISSLKKMGVSVVGGGGGFVFSGTPTFNEKDEIYTFNRMQASAVAAKIREFRAFDDKFIPIFSALTEMSSTLHSIRRALVGLRTDADRLAITLGLASLPDEVLSSIFILAQRAQDKDKAKFSIAISQVCRRFREVAIGTPLLWNHVALMMPKDMVHTFLRRSGDVRLHVTISDSWTGGGGAIKDFEKDFFRAVFYHLERVGWLDLKIFCLPPENSRSSQIILSIFQHLSDKCLPRLEELRIHYPDYVGSSGIAPFPVDLLLQGYFKLPSLRTLKIGTKGHFPAVQFGDKLSTIVVELASGSVEMAMHNFLFLLATSTSLNHVTLIFSCPYKSRAIELPIANGVAAPSITSFILITYHDETFNDPTFRTFTRSFYFPNLSHLSIKAKCMDIVDCWHLSSETYQDERLNGDFTPFLEDVFAGCESYPALRNFELELTPEAYHTKPFFNFPFAKYMPNLKHFGVAVGMMSETWHPALPALRSLRVEGCRIKDVSWIQAFVEEMISSGMDEHFDSLRVSCTKQVLTEIRNKVKLPSTKIDAYESRRSKLDFHDGVGFLEEIDDYLPKGMAVRR
ncbi:hypothetical protein SCHPADRAFT_929356 [Schizopora paradoxa]|uniref:F-box domain-containing protein n=1 Tax=Schizopora paradoxa TaxID=27342 RepID=A0A0H2RJV7_9AGAM|nr:hypothetical protein SCHPADRAFT_929356 [Schizopora paradoxa]